MSGSRAPGLPAQLLSKVTSLLCPSTPIGDQGAPDGARVPMLAGGNPTPGPSRLPLRAGLAARP